MANGTVALELALYALGIGPSDEVVVPSRGTLALSTVAKYLKLKPLQYNERRVRAADQFP